LSRNRMLLPHDKGTQRKGEQNRETEFHGDYPPKDF
jgi:hypothetical protein